MGLKFFAEILSDLRVTFDQLSYISASAIGTRATGFIFGMIGDVMMAHPVPH